MEVHACLRTKVDLYEHLAFEDSRGLIFFHFLLGDGKHNREGSCVGTKGFRAPEVSCCKCFDQYKNINFSVKLQLTRNFNI